jgi:hypothetical protein
VDTREFFETVWGDQSGNVVLGQMSEPGPKGQLNKSWDFVWPDQIDDIVNFANTHSSTDIYYSPLIYGDMRAVKDDGSPGRLRRVPENAISSRVVYQDSDTCPITAFKVKPSIHLTTSTGKYQDLWVLDEPVTAEEAALLSRKIAVAHREDGSDPSSWSANKFLRIPFSTNTRHGFPERVTLEAWGDIYDTGDINRHYGNVDVEVYRPIARMVDNYSDSDQDLPDFGQSYDLVPHEEVERLHLDRLVFEPYEEGRRSETRYRLLCQLFRVNPPLEFERILAIAWHAPATSKWREDARNVRGLIMEAQKAQTEVMYEKGVGVEAPTTSDLTVTELPKIDRAEVVLLSDDERNRVANENHFVRRYETWSQSKLGPAHNGPYARMNAWSTLSCAFADMGFIPSTGDSLNLFAMGVGDSGSGKSSARRLYDHVTKEIFDQDAGWWIGVNASPQALHEVLLERDEKVSVFMADEAHGWFKTVNNAQWADGTYEAIALYYDGDVPPIHKTTKRDLSGKRARTYFLTHLMGTLKGELSITNVLTRSMFYSGFLPRFTWYIGDERVVTPDSMAETNGDGEAYVNGFEPMARQWAAEFANTKKQLRSKHRKRRIPMNMTPEALSRLVQFKWNARELANKRPEWELLEPCMIRIGPNVRRCASLLALADGRDEVTLTDTLCAIEQAEEWLQALFYMVERVSESQWARETDEIELFLLGKGGSARYETVMAKFRSRRSRDLMEQINSLYLQGRVSEKNVNGKKFLQVNERSTD